MKSPITGKEMLLTKERRSMYFRKEKFDIVFHFYKCEDSGEQFTTNALDDLNTNQIYNQYRNKFSIPFPDEISKIRKKYDLSAAKISEILGFGVNTYRKYEAGEMPSVANAKLIRMADEPDNFRKMVALCNTLSENQKEKYLKKASLLSAQNTSGLNFKDYLLGKSLPDIYSGYRCHNFKKFTEMVVYFSDVLSPYKTKMNKLLFYADFLMFQKSCFSISGLRYKAIDMGPVSHKFQSLFEYLSDNREIDIQLINFPQGYFGEKFNARPDRKFKAEVFTEEELETLKKVAAHFKDTSTKEIVELSHLEEAWKKNETTKSEISYEYAFELHSL